MDKTSKTNASNATLETLIALCIKNINSPHSNVRNKIDYIETISPTRGIITSKKIVVTPVTNVHSDDSTFFKSFKEESLKSKYSSDTLARSSPEIQYDLDSSMPPRSSPEIQYDLDSSTPPRSSPEIQYDLDSSMPPRSSSEISAEISTAVRQNSKVKINMQRIVKRSLKLGTNQTKKEEAEMAKLAKELHVTITAKNDVLQIVGDEDDVDLFFHRWLRRDEERLKKSRMNMVLSVSILVLYLVISLAFQRFERSSTFVSDHLPFNKSNIPDVLTTTSNCIKAAEIILSLINAIIQLFCL